MSKLVQIDLNYREKGKNQILTVDVDFVSNWVIDQYQKIINQQTQVKDLWEKFKGLSEQARELSVLKPEGYKDKSEKVVKQADKIAKEIKEIGATGTVQNRIIIIKQIFEDNGVEDEKFLNEDFLNKCVEPSEQTNFITKCVYKDLSDSPKLAEIATEQ